MDPISHVLLARTMGRVTAPAPAAAPGRTAALALGSLAPDIDLVVAPFGWDRYLVVHEVAAHTLLWSPLLALAAARVVRWFVKSARVRELWAPAWLGVIVGHLVFDLVSGSDMRLLSPISPVRWGPHWLTMADALVIAVLVGGTIAGVWWRQLAARATLVALVVLVGVKAISQEWATEAFARQQGRPTTHPEAVGGSLWQWTFFDRFQDDVRVWRVHAWTATTTLAFTRHDLAGDPVVRTSTEATVVRRLLSLAHEPFARLEAGDNGHRLVVWSDIRHCRETRCDLSFGVEIDQEGRMLRQFARIGPINQWRTLK